MLSVKNIVDPMSPMSRDALATAKSFIPLKSLRHGFLEELFLNVQPQSVPAGQIIFEEGGYDHQVVYLSAGSVALNYPSGHREVLSAAESLLPLANQQPRPAQAEAIEDCVVLRVDSDTLDRTLSWSQITDYILSELAIDRAHDGNLPLYTTILSSNLFFKVPSINAEKIFSRLQTVQVNQGDTIIHEGDLGDCCYFLQHGVAKIYKQKNNKDELLAEILPGRCFGEDALVDKKPRNASVVMSTDGVLMKLEKADFLRLLHEPEVEEISLVDFDQRQDQPTLIDIRTEAEYRLGHLAMSANIPLSILSMKKRLLSPEKLYVMYCDTGRRSKAAAFFLGKLGYNAVSLAGGLQKQQLLDRLVTQPSYMLRAGQLIKSDD